jgi:hypothetical protein
MSHIKTLKNIPTCFDHQLIIIRELICSYLKSVKIRVFICGERDNAAAYMHLFYVLSGVESYAGWVCITLHTRYHVKEMHVCYRIITFTTYEDSNFN